MLVGFGAVSVGTNAHAAPKPAPSPPLQSYADYSATNSAPNGVTSAIRYGTKGDGSPQATDCTITATSDFQTKINGAPVGAVVCVQAPQGQTQGDYSTLTMTVTKGIAVRAKGVVKVKNIIIGGTAPATVDGFNVVGGTLGNPNYAIKFSGTGHQIINNLVRGRGIWYGIGCEQSAGCGSKVRSPATRSPGCTTSASTYGAAPASPSRRTISSTFTSRRTSTTSMPCAPGATTISSATTTSTTSTATRAPVRRTPIATRPIRLAAAARLSANITYENNYCVRVTGQCFIVQNDQRKLPRSCRTSRCAATSARPTAGRASSSTASRTSPWTTTMWPVCR